jgi:hypothetical protein
MKIEDTLPDFLTAPSTPSTPSKEFKNCCAFMDLEKMYYFFKN